MNEQPLSSFDSTNNTEIFPKSSTEKEPQLQTIVLFDWDDTLFCTKYLNMHNLNYNDIFSFQTSIEEVCCYVNTELKELEQVILTLFDELISEREVKLYIVSNADLKWIENCLMHFLPELNEYIKEKGIKIYSAKNMFSSHFSLGKWKSKCFRKVLHENHPEKKIALRILSIGDSIEEKKASLEISSMKYYNKIEVSFLEMIKGPSIRSIIQQLSFIMEHFDEIINRREFLHRLCYDENKANKAQLKYEVTKESKLHMTMLSKKRKRNEAVQEEDYDLFKREFEEEDVDEKEEEIKDEE